VIAKTPSAAQRLAAVFKQTFRTQRMQADAGKERFGDWNRRIAAAIGPFLAIIYAKELRRQKVSFRQEDVDNLVYTRAYQVARDLNATSSEWLESGRDPKDVFSVNRAVAIAMNESAFAVNQARVDAAAQRKKKLRWVIGGKPCKECKSLAGKVVRPGVQFKTKSGMKIDAPPLHPNCKCTVEEV
jgi:hypothetical protein